VELSQDQRGRHAHEVELRPRVTDRGGKGVAQFR